MLYSEQPTVLLDRIHQNTTILINFKNLIFFYYIVIFVVRSNYLYLINNHRQPFSWPGECLPTLLRVTKMWFDPNIKSFRNSSVRIFAAEKTSLVYEFLETFTTFPQRRDTQKHSSYINNKSQVKSLSTCDENSDSG